MAFEAPQLSGAVALLHDSFEQLLSGLRISRKCCAHYESFYFLSPKVKVI